jgi:mycothiol system anti-sigma-R factor
MSDDCEPTMDRLSLYLDRELSEEEVRQVRRHLDECPPCERVFEFQSGLKRLVRRECCTDDAPARLREWVRKLASQEPDRLA